MCCRLYFNNLHLLLTLTVSHDILDKILRKITLLRQKRDCVGLSQMYWCRYGLTSIFARSHSFWLLFAGCIEKHCLLQQPHHIRRYWKIDLWSYWMNQFPFRQSRIWLQISLPIYAIFPVCDVDVLNRFKYNCIKCFSFTISIILAYLSITIFSLQRADYLLKTFSTIFTYFFINFFIPFIIHQSTYHLWPSSTYHCFHVI